MHHFIYPSKDTYITNESNFTTKNFGIDEILEVKGNSQIVKTVSVYQSGPITQSYCEDTGTYILNFGVDDFLSGSITAIEVYVNETYYCPMDVYLFSGLYTGYMSGSNSGLSTIYITSSVDLTSLEAFSGIITGSINGTTTSSAVSNVSGSISGSAEGTLVGSWKGIIEASTGSVSSFTGLFSGSLIGSSSVYSPVTDYANIPLLSRALLKFDISSISESIANGTITNTGSIKFNLKMEISEVKEVPLTYSIYAYPVSQSWEMGNGRYETGGTTTGTSWYYRDFSSDTGTYWHSITSSTLYKFVDYLNTASYSSESFNKGGGTWYYSVPASYVTSSFGFCSSLSASKSLITKQDFDYESSNLNIDVTEIVRSWICGCVPNEGFILLTSLEISRAEDPSGTFKFFSRDTNTIYSPYLDVQWDDSVYTTGSLTSITSTIPYNVTLKNLNKNYKFGAMPRIDVFARAKNPLKTFNSGYQLNSYITSSLLPSSSFYAIKDNESEKMILDFDDSTKLSCDGNMHYFMLNTTSLTQERYYRLLIKVVGNNETQIFDNGYIFKVTR
jgi:hypothetical protein